MSARSIAWLRWLWPAVCVLAAFAAAARGQEPGGTDKPAPGDAAETLKAAGIEPSAQGVRQFLEAAIAPESEREVERLIQQLGDPLFSVRETATRRLSALPLLPGEKLEAAALSDDPERAFRAKLILAAIREATDTPLRAALRLVREKRLDVEPALLLRLLERSDDRANREALVRAMAAVVRPEHRPLAEDLLKRDDAALRNVGRRLLAQLTRPGEAPLLEGAFEAVFVKTGGIAGGGSDLICGWEFKPKSALTVTHLGLLDHGADGLNVPHEVAIWRLDAHDKPLALATVPAGKAAELSGVFRYVPVEPVALAAGESYVVVAHYANPTDSSVSMINPSGLVVKFSEHLEVVGRRYTFPHARMAFPAQSQTDPKHASLGPSFRYEASPDAP
jgi:hypothetical protein